ncbi:MULTISPECIES: winged helix-turn-helix domain-containing protein [Photobacterium]|uniref:winged helix-turn-helix domain-containing protein n=1 Tax=Photobacterium TaxID=657 RepID=UPI0006B5D0A7|nr:MULTISPECIES: response regulator transcription factor [Photobacterium]MBP2700265.1 response regulator transcription factor [Vibrio parahaemolyticus]KPA51180.1 transcriptional regulator [Photobacterium leiognathi subsp. mandapamensis]MZG55977.1 response regulator transcription factor [Photobacterium lucens]MZG81582.1 response regulator transcription factor [Photobacterium lucens]PSV19395.1 DNA-binding response regulator [Photobacterium leiognathi subsp. mandapamensis]
MKVLVIEDDITTREFIAQGLREHGFVVDEAEDGHQGLMMATSCDYQLIILDRMLPMLDGLKVLAALRATENQTPILILSAMDSVEDRVAGLTAGSDDYLTKPFALAELVARAKILVKRNQASTTISSEYIYDDLRLDIKSHRVWRGSRMLNLQQKEFLLLQYLMEHAESVVSRMSLFESVWSYHFDPKTNVIDVHIANLRKKLEEGGEPSLIHTVRGAGYVLRRI